THLGTTSPVGQALSTPLGLFLARTLYNPRPHHRDTHAVTPHPDELCDATRFPDQDSLHAHLFDAYIPAAYSADSSDDARWTAERAERSLTFLARFLENQQGGSPNLAWWKIPHAVPAYLRRLTTMLMFGCVSGAALGIEVGLTGGPGAWFGLAGGVLSGTLAAFTVDPVPGTSLRWSPRRGAIAFLCGLASGFVIQARQVLEAEFDDGLGNGITLGLMAGIAFGLKPVTPDLSTVVGPATLLSSDRRTFITITLAGALAGGLAGVVSGPMVGADFPIGIVVPGVIGLAVGLGIGLTQTAWPHFVIARAHLGLRGELPRELIGFLQDAHEKRGVLRHVGAEYQFRHIDLQRHLAQRPPL
ncbi:NACHT domain-containing protein, partial [Streptomyces sp. NPDC058947]